jgi:CIC family chloride channel protein
VHDIIDREPATLHANANLASILEQVLDSERSEFFVLDENDRMLGTIHLRQLTRTLMEQDILRHVIVAGDLIVSHEAALSEDDNLDVVMRMFSHGLAEELPIVDATDPLKLVGSVHKRDVLHAYNQEVMRRDLAGEISSTVVVAHRGQQVELGGGYVLQEIQPPPRFFGKTIRELDIGAVFGVQVVLIRKHGAAGEPAEIRVPGADDSIAEGDRLVVAGSKAAVESMDVI